MKFNTPIYHPNVSLADGRLCWRELDSSGSKFQANILISAIGCLMEEPNADSPLNSEAAALFRSNRAAYNAKARAESKKFAMF